jgi:hypothetical protein
MTATHPTTSTTTNRTAIVGSNFSLPGWRGKKVILEREIAGQAWLCRELGSAVDTEAKVYIDEANLVAPISGGSPEAVAAPATHYRLSIEARTYASPDGERL